MLGFEQDLVDALSFLEPPAARGARRHRAAALGGGEPRRPRVPVRAAPLPAARVPDRRQHRRQRAGERRDRVRRPGATQAHRQRPGRSAPACTSAASITATGIAILAASFVLLGPFLGSRWRQAGALLLAAFVAMRVVALGRASGRGVPGARHRRRGRCRHVARVRATRPAPVGRHRGRQPRQRRDHRLRPRRAHPRDGAGRASSSPPSTTARSSWSRSAAPPSARPISCSASTGGSG